VVRVTVIPGASLTALLAFEHKICADALIGSNGMNLGGRPIYTKSIAPTLDQVSQIDESPSPTYQGNSSPEVMLSSSPLVTPTPSTRPSIASLRPVSSPIDEFNPFGDESPSAIKLNPQSEAFVPVDDTLQDQDCGSAAGSKLVWCQ